MPRIGKCLTPVDQKTIGSRIREVRKRRALTQIEVAERLGIQQALLSAYERGEVRVHAALVAAFAQLFRVSADEILGLKDCKESDPINDRRFLRRLERIDRLPKRKKDALLTTIDAFLKES